MQGPRKKQGILATLIVTFCLTISVVLWPKRSGYSTGHPEYGYHSIPYKYPSPCEPYVYINNGKLSGKNVTSSTNLEGQAPIPFMGNYQCSTELCTEFLTEDDWNWVRWATPRDDLQFQGACRFMNGTNRPAVLLMSYTGSGNTWLRGLLEQATGICTGSMYRDIPLRRGGFHGEGVRSGTVLVTKCHVAKWPSWSNAAILLIRNPLDAFVAEWNLLQSNANVHVGLVSSQNFGNNPNWTKYIHGHWKKRGWFSAWTDYFKWLVDSRCSGRPVLVVKYEDLKSDLMTQMKKILEFLGVPYSDEALQRRINSGNFEKFHRPHRKETDFDHYTPEQRLYVKGLVKEAIQYLRLNNQKVTYGIEEYL